MPETGAHHLPPGARELVDLIVSHLPTQFLLDLRDRVMADPRVLAEDAAAAKRARDGFRSITIRRAPERAVCWFWAGDRWRDTEPQSGDVALACASARRRILHQRCLVIDVGVDPNVVDSLVRYDKPDPWGR